MGNTCATEQFQSRMPSRRTRRERDMALQQVSQYFLFILSCLFRTHILTHMHTLTTLERMLAAQNPLTQMDRPHQLFADAPPTLAAAAVPPTLPTMPPPFMPPSMMHFMPGMGMGGAPLHMPPPPPPMGGGSEFGTLWSALVRFWLFWPPSAPRSDATAHAYDDAATPTPTSGQFQKIIFVTFYQFFRSFDTVDDAFTRASSAQSAPSTPSPTSQTTRFTHHTGHTYYTFSCCVYVQTCQVARRHLLASHPPPSWANHTLVVLITPPPSWANHPLVVLITPPPSWANHPLVVLITLPPSWAKLHHHRHQLVAPHPPPL